MICEKEVDAKIVAFLKRKKNESRINHGIEDIYFEINYENKYGQFEQIDGNERAWVSSGPFYNYIHKTKNDQPNDPSSPSIYSSPMQACLLMGDIDIIRRLLNDGVNPKYLTS